MIKVSELIHLKGPHVHTIPGSTTVAEAARAFLEKEVGSFLVGEDGQVLGIFTKNDLVRLAVEQEAGFGEHTVESVMTRDLFTTTPDADLDDVFGTMVDRGVRHVPVLDDGKAVGVITSIDILVHQKDAISFENEELLKYISGGY